MRRTAVISLLMTILVLALVKAVPFLKGPIVVTESTPVPQALAAAAEIKLRPGNRLCVTNVTLSPDSRFVQFTLRGGTLARSPVEVSASSDGYAARTRVRAGSEGTLTAPLAAPRNEKDGRVCVRNAGRRTIVLLGVPPGRGQTIASTLLNGRPQKIDASLSTFRSLESSRTGAFPKMLERAAAFSVLPTCFLWILALALAIAVPVFLALALAKSFE